VILRFFSIYGAEVFRVILVAVAAAQAPQSLLREPLAVARCLVATLKTYFNHIWVQVDQEQQQQLFP
jgi:hypothetical protein